MAVEYFDFGFQSAVSESEQLYYDTDLVKWATGSVYNEWTRQEIAEKVSVNLNVKQKGNGFVADMYIIPGNSLEVISTHDSDAKVSGFYNDLEGKNEASCLQSLSGSWVGSHDYVDEVLSANYRDYSKDDYACSYIRPMTTLNALVLW